MKHKCPIKGCNNQVDHEKLMCPGHWSLVPKELGNALYRAWAARKANPDSGAGVHIAAMTACINYVDTFLADKKKGNANQGTFKFPRR